ncbi:unnamed protein product [Blepharisma stoltei]|uniref:Uncharacterized protein n=1 Tax=Blepharisma stoltei TaxID=1481888 RepID=A0AAU9JKU1_9CILI|nr:unnamed protein product [Blepharisma stoltei]
MLVLGWWIVDITVLPFLACSINKSITTSAVKLSRPEVGSSSKRTIGSVISSIPMQTLFLSPPERPFLVMLPMILSAHFTNLSSWIIVFTLSTLSL